MSSSDIPSVFESNNARHLNPTKVASTFVPPSTFDDLCRRGNAIIVGPRGSGKTTLLKMLQPSALLSWTAPEASYFINRIDFAGVFISADAIFGEELASYRDLRTSEGVVLQGRLFRHSRYVTHCLASFVRALDELRTLPSLKNIRLDAAKKGYLERVALPLTLGQEAEFVDALAREWHLDLNVRSIGALLLALTARHSRTRTLYLKSGSSKVQDLVEQHPFLALDLPDCLRFLIDALHTLSEKPRTTPWALLFDELEIVPDEIRTNIFALQRAGIPNALFKLTMFATTPVQQQTRFEYRPQGRDDYTQIPLWYSYKENAFGFCASLFKQMVLERHQNPQPFRSTPPAQLAESILGASRFDLGRRMQRGGHEVYTTTSEVAQELKELETKDPGLREYLKQRDLRLSELGNLAEPRRAATIRKLASIAVVRNEFLKSGRRSRRSRKNPTIYSGASTLFSISEGNPRLLIGLCDPLIERWLKHGRTVIPAAQSRYVRFWADRFQALLSNYMVERGERSPYRSYSREIVGLTDLLGERFEQNVHGPQFNGDPVLSFFVDKNVDRSLVEAVTIALNAGALVHIPDNSNRPLGPDIVGHRFRLSYLFAPRYQLPLIIGKARALSDLLGRRTAPDLFEGRR